MLAALVRRGRESGRTPMGAVAVDGTRIQANVSGWNPQARLAQIEEGERPVKIKDRQGRFFTGFNFQVAVDIQTGFILGEQVLAQAHDHEAMAPVLESIEDTAGSLPAAILADAGYDDGRTHTALAQRGVLGIVAPQDGKASFWRINSSGEPCCPMGHVPQPKGVFVRKGKRWQRLTVRQCASCPLQRSCRVKGGKALCVPEGSRASDRILNSERFKYPDIQELFKARGQTVELVFARLKTRYRLGRSRFATLSKTRSEFRMFCLCENLRILGKALLLWIFGSFQSLKRTYIRLQALLLWTFGSFRFGRVGKVVGTVNFQHPKPAT
jgi:hypothetical protein